jgi:hypothetical protein
MTGTPGPWTAKTEKFPVDIVTREGFVVASCDIDPALDGDAAIQNQLETIADAKVMAAAPNLAEALRTVLERYVTVIASGDCGHSDDPEIDPMVIAARMVLTQAGL